MVKCQAELKRECMKEIVKELENRFIEGVIKHSKLHGNNVPFEMCLREYKGKKYHVFLSVKEEA